MPKTQARTFLLWESPMTSPQNIVWLLCHVGPGPGMETLVFEKSPLIVFEMNVNHVDDRLKEKLKFGAI